MALKRCDRCPRRTRDGRELCKYCARQAAVMSRRSPDAVTGPVTEGIADISEAEIEARYQAALAAIRRRPSR